ncbi:MAG: 2-hydroxyacyl-CoA dehydratase family protein [Desulfobacterales bacterium]
MNAFEELKTVSGTLKNHYVDEWKAQGRKVIGYACTYLPEELLYAMDMLPYRITGRGITDTSQADSYMSRVNCSFVRCCLEAALESKFDFLDGVIFINGCDHIRRCYENWAVHDIAARPFMHILPVPHRISEPGFAWFTEEVTRMKEALEKRFAARISPDALSRAISVYNETRRLLRQMYDLRASDSPPFTGAQALTITTASNLMPRESFNRLLSELLEESAKSPPAKNDKTRLVIAGSLMDDPEFIENVEDLGAVVVSDSLCFGARSFWNLTPETGDPFEALCRRYYEHEPCPRMSGDYKRRLAFLMDQIERSRADGAVLEYIKFCDQHGTDNALLKHHLQKEHIPVIELERQYGPLADAGRVRTRIQAFLERIGD